MSRSGVIHGRPWRTLRFPDQRLGGQGHQWCNRKSYFTPSKIPRKCYVYLLENCQEWDLLWLGDQVMLSPALGDHGHLMLDWKIRLVIINVLKWPPWSFGHANILFDKVIMVWHYWVPGHVRSWAGEVKLDQVRLGFINNLMRTTEYSRPIFLLSYKGLQ